MSTDRSSSVEHSALSERVEAIESDTEALGQAMARSRRSRLLVLSCLLAIVVIFSYLFLNLGKRFTDPSRQKEFAGLALDHFFDGLDHNVSEDLEWEQQLEEYQQIALKELEDMGRESTPVIEAAFRNQFDQDMGKYTAMMSEQRELLVKNLQERADQLMQDRYKEILEQHEHILKEEFKDLSVDQQDRILVNFNVAMEQLLKKYYRDDIEQQIDTLYETFDRFPAAGPASDDITLPQQLLGTTVETLSVKLVGESHPVALVADADPAVSSSAESVPSTDEAAAPDSNATPSNGEGAAPTEEKADASSAKGDEDAAAKPESPSDGDATAKPSADKDVTEKPTVEKKDE